MIDYTIYEIKRRRLHGKEHAPKAKYICQRDEFSTNFATYAFVHLLEVHPTDRMRGRDEFGA